MLAEAVGAWVESPARIRRNPGSDAAHYLMRLVESTKPLPGGTMVYRGEGFDSPQALLERAKVFLESGGQELRPLVASASVNAGVALDFAGRNGPWRMVIEVKDSKTGKLISPTVARAADIFVGEEEVLIPQGARFRLLGRRWSLWRR